jgi:hypothetical protein
MKVVSFTDETRSFQVLERKIVIMAVKAAPTSKPVVPPANSAAPGTQGKPKKEKKAKIAKIAHPSLLVDGVAVKIEKMPEDFDAKIHLPLKKKDFKSEAFFIDFQADQLELRVKQLREDAEKSRKMGSTAGNAKAKKLLQMQSKMAELLAELEKDGVDIKSIMGE